MLDLQNLDGWVITREFLVDPEHGFDYYCFYPKKLNGIPPYFYATKEEAEKKLPEVIDEFKMFKGTKLKVAKFEDWMYLNRF